MQKSSCYLHPPKDMTNTDAHRVKGCILLESGWSECTQFAFAFISFKNPDLAHHAILDLNQPQIQPIST